MNAKAIVVRIALHEPKRTPQQSFFFFVAGSIAIRKVLLIICLATFVSWLQIRRSLLYIVVLYRYSASGLTV